MSYVIVDENGNAQDFSSIAGLRDMETEAPPALMKFLDSGKMTAEEAKRVANEVRNDDTLGYIADLLDNMTGVVILSDGLTEDDSQDNGDDPADFQEGQFANSEYEESESNRHNHAKRVLTKYEQRVDFAQAQKVLDASELAIKERLQKELEAVQETTLKWVKDNGANLKASQISDFIIESPPELQQTLKDMFEVAWTDGRDAGVSELPIKIRKEPKVQEIKTFGDYLFMPPWWEDRVIWSDRALKVYANAFEPTEAIDAFDNRAWLISDVISSTLQSQIRYELFEHLKGGRTLNETIGNIRQVFEPWVGDPSKLAPGSEDILSAFRIENIIRTETTWGYNQGRLAVADTAGDYVLGFQFSAIIDSRTTEVCRKADGLVLRKDAATTIKLTPPLFYQCRSLLIYVTQIDVPIEWSSEHEINAAIELIPKEFK